MTSSTFSCDLVVGYRMKMSNSKRKYNIANLLPFFLVDFTLKASSNRQQCIDIAAYWKKPQVPSSKYNFISALVLAKAQIK